MGHQQPYHPRPRWVFIAHPQKLAVVVKILSKSGFSVQPPTNMRFIRSIANGYKTSRWTHCRLNRQPTFGSTGPIGSTARQLSRQLQNALVLVFLNRALGRFNRVPVQPPTTGRFNRSRRNDFNFAFLFNSTLQITFAQDMKCKQGFT